MKEILVQAMLSFFAAACFGFIFNIPRKLLIQSGIVGIVGWLTYKSMTDAGIEAVQATFVGGVSVSVMSYLMAKMYKTPIIIFMVAGLIPLVPGGSAYDAMRHIVSNQYDAAIPLAFKALIISGAIALGIVFAQVLVDLINEIIRLFMRVVNMRKDEQ